MKIRIKKLNASIDFPTIIKKGEWIDLRASKLVQLSAPKVVSKKVVFDNQLVPLGVAMKLPKSYEAHILPRSSTFNTWGVLLANSQGIIDNSYSGNDDEWKANLLATKDVTIKPNDRICQFRIELSQKATIWQKIKWIFSRKIELVEVNDLGDNNRSGFGTTGTN